MLLRADTQPFASFALRDPDTGVIRLGHIAATRSEAEKLLAKQRIHMPHHGHLEIIPIEITVKEKRA
ncbi:hypothetical protein [Dyella sp.]|uniref:hypothetical protein n=1 Tax=Dyella sp. TaxID=1869338 RepID=UPI002FDB8449